MLIHLTSSVRRRWHTLVRLCRNRPKTVLLTLLLLYIFTSYDGRRHVFYAQPHAITGYSIEFERDHHLDPALESEHHGFLPLSEAKKICKAHRWSPYPARTSRRKVYDLIMVNDEMDWLEIRLQTLAAAVDYFVVVESPVTFTGLEKKLVLQENWDRFKEWHGKIIYKLLDNPPIGAKRTWDYEDFQRNAMFLQTFPAMTGMQKPEMGDVILVSDVDEVPRPASVMLLRNCNVGRRVTLRSRFYYYGFQYLHVGPEWAHPQATIFEGLGKGHTILPADLRNGEGGNRLKGWWDKEDIWNAGWHCSTCFENISQVLRKMGSFSHTSLNQEIFRDPTRIVDRVRKGSDLWDRKGEKYDFIRGNEDVPGFLKQDRERWSYLLSRDGGNAGFKDYTEGKLPGE